MKKENPFYFLVFFAIFFFAFGLIAYPQDTAQAVRDALTLCFQSVIPSLFPFFVLAKLATNLRFANLFKKTLNKIMIPLFSIGASASPAVLLGFIGGYPVGAATIATLYNEKLCSKEETERALAFCNNCGPAFVIGAIGSGVFSSSKAGISLFAIHILSAIFVGVIFRIVSPITERQIKFENKTHTVDISFPNAFTNAVLSALNSSLNISAYVILFSVLICILNLLRIFPVISHFISTSSGIDASLIEAVMSGIIEMTIGAYSLIEYSNFKAAFIIISFLLGWGGLSVHCQTLSCISDYNLSTKQYFLGKLMQSIISTIIAYIYVSFTDTSISYTPHTSIFLDIAPIVISIIPIIFIFIFCKKGWKKTK